MFPFVLKALGTILKPCLSFAQGHWLNRNPIKVTLAITGLPPMVTVKIVNTSQSLNVHIGEVRVHYGNEHFSRAFALHPRTSVELTPKTKQEWRLTYEDTTLIERARQREQPTATNPNAQPGIESPAQLFNAIGMGDKRHSWIEVDFNEFEDRQFLRGEVQSVFDTVGKQHLALRSLPPNETRTDDLISPS